MRAGIARAVLAGLVVPAMAGAQTLSFTEAQVIERVGPGTARVEAPLAAVDVARADVLDAGRWPNPQVSYIREAVAGVTEQMWLVSQPLPITGRRGLDVQAASALVEASASRAEDEVRRLRADARLAYVALWSAQVRERELAESGERLRHLAAVIARREAAGDAAGFDRLRAAREAVEVDALRALAAADRASAQARLASYVAPPVDGALVEAASLERFAGALPSVDDLVAHAERTRGDLRALQHDVEAAAFAERAAGRLRLPEPTVVAGTKSSNIAGGDVGLVLSVQAIVPLFDSGGPRRAAAQALASRARAEADALRQVLRGEIAAWRAAVVERRAIADQYREQAGAMAGEIERIAQVSYDAGERTILELIDAYRTTAAARVRQAELDAAVRAAEIELAYVSGWEMP